MNVQLNELQRRHQEVAAEVESRLLDVVRSGKYIGGTHVEAVEQFAAAAFERTAAVGVNSGTDALMLALQAIGVQPGDEVIVPALSFFATAGAVAAIGAVPRVVDVREDGLIDPQAAENAISPRTRAIVPVHLFGAMAPFLPFDLPIVDDAAQAIGGTPSRSIGVLTTLSAYPTKTWGAAGDAGFVIGDDPELLSRVRKLGNHGMSEPHHHHRVAGTVGRNSRLDPMQAAVLLGHAPLLTDRIARRRLTAARYDRELPQSWLRLPRDPGSPVHHYVVRHPRREAIREHLAIRGIETAIHYPLSLGRQPALVVTPCPMAERLTSEMFALPVHDQLTESEITAVLTACAECR